MGVEEKRKRGGRRVERGWKGWMEGGNRRKRSSGQIDPEMHRFISRGNISSGQEFKKRNKWGKKKKEFKKRNFPGGQS